ncbi:unnamed protein product [Didymodactylos carnosus]|uniref:Tudor domain-containing protein n=1 Tax=Didymodactylos carnosus TaxID=1234261 RepID=A0A814V366_9BILA|nr:unnamed protein product [Didymodactylos carnosus]CAF1183498.1 unnamed protein product [Didymodactylos carnosus]CAF3841123.1 unnamed protein product [Didymodactylos carnosus]CAF3947877.1 unnamed protein product [Didymodactylos carnosus]
MLKDEPIASTSLSSTATTSVDNDTSYKEYLNVDLRKTPYKCLPEDFVDSKSKTIKGKFLVQIEDVENADLNDQENNSESNTEANGESLSSSPGGIESSLKLTITDGFTTCSAVTTGQIAGLTTDTALGSKLTLFGVIPIKSSALQLSSQNCRWISGSSTHPRPKSYYREGGSRSGSDGYKMFNARRNGRYQDEDEYSYTKRPLPLSLFSFIGPKFKGLDMNDSSNSKEYSSTSQRDTYSKHDDYSNTKPSSYSNKEHGNYHRGNIRYPSPSSSSQQNNNTSPTTRKTTGSITDSSTNENKQQNFRERSYRNNYESTSNYPRTQQQNNQTDGRDSQQQQQVYRERRNPLPPRLQRAQEERTRRNTNRYYEDPSYVTGGEDALSPYNNGDTNGHRNDVNSRRSYRNQIGSSNQSSYPHNAMISGGMGETLHAATPLANNYYFTNQVMSAYSLAAPQTSIYQQMPYNCTSNDQYTYCYGYPKEAIYTTALPSTWTPDMLSAASVSSNDPNNSAYYNVQTQSNGSPINGDTSTTNTNGTKTNGNNDNADIEQPPSSPVEDRQSQQPQQQQCDNQVQDTTSNQQDFKTNNNEKRRDSNSNSRTWQIGDFCMARWKDDGQFYCANIVGIQQNSCIVLFKDYNNYEQVLFSELKPVPRDQLQHLIANQMTTSHLDGMNRLLPTASLFRRPGYSNDGIINYNSSLSDTVIMPEAPPFPFHSNGNLFVCAPLRTVRYSNNGNYNKLSKSKQNNSVQQQSEKQEDENINGANIEQSSLTNDDEQSDNLQLQQSKQDENITSDDSNKESKYNDSKEKDIESEIGNMTTTSEQTNSKRTSSMSSSSSHGRSTSTASVIDHNDEISASIAANKDENQQQKSTGEEHSDNQQEENVCEFQTLPSTDHITPSESIVNKVEESTSETNTNSNEANPDETKIKDE